MVSVICDPAENLIAMGPLSFAAAVIGKLWVVVPSLTMKAAFVEHFEGGMPTCAWMRVT